MMLPEGDIDGSISLNTELMRCEVWGSAFTMASNRCRGLLSLCTSDTAKDMLLSNSGFIPHLIDGESRDLALVLDLVSNYTTILSGLLLDPEHPRKDTDEAVKAVVQRDFAECIQQISLFPPGCEALKADSSVVAALDALVNKAWSEEAKDCARGALMQLTDRQRESVSETGNGDARHIMMSCECTPVSSMIVFGLALTGAALCRPMGRPGGRQADRFRAAAQGLPSVVRP